TCTPYLKTIENTIDNIDVRKVAVKPSTENFKQDANSVIRTSWQIRQALHKKLPEVDFACANQMQANFRQLRFIEEYLLEHLTKVTDLHPEDKSFKWEYTRDYERKIPIKEQAPEYFYQSTGIETDANFKSGDIMV